MPNMTLERALEINEILCLRTFATLGFHNGQLTPLDGISLRDALDAVTIVEAENVKPGPDGKKVITTVPAERLIAAVFTFEHYQPSSQAILSVPTVKGTHRMLAVVEMPVAPQVANDDEDAAYG